MSDLEQKTKSDHFDFQVAADLVQLRQQRVRDFRDDNVLSGQALRRYRAVELFSADCNTAN